MWGAFVVFWRGRFEKKKSSLAWIRRYSAMFWIVQNKRKKPVQKGRKFAPCLGVDPASFSALFTALFSALFTPAVYTYIGRFCCFVFGSLLFSTIFAVFNQLNTYTHEQFNAIIYRRRGSLFRPLRGAFLHSNKNAKQVNMYKPNLNERIDLRCRIVRHKNEINALLEKAAKIDAKIEGALWFFEGYENTPDCVQYLKTLNENKARLMLHVEYHENDIELYTEILKR